MKLFLSFVLYYALIINCYGQSAPIQPSGLKLKRGIYLTFAEINTATPARSDSFTIRERTSGDIFLVGGGKYSFELASKDKREFRELRKALVGVSDGENFYISDRFTVNGWQGMTRCILDGPYLIADIKGSAAQYAGGGIIPGQITVNSGYLINLKTGRSSSITKKTLRELLSNYPNIAKDYQNKMDLTEFAIPIVDAVNQQEKNQRSNIN